VLRSERGEDDYLEREMFFLQVPETGLSGLNRFISWDIDFVTELSGFLRTLIYCDLQGFWFQ